MGHRHCFPIYTYKRGDMDKNDLQKKKNTMKIIQLFIFVEKDK